ncbi:MAG: FAD-dependent monooxygenase [Hyphomicrobiaceae bacterium]|nr:FAD-dependent monooxygenase [Hyphomicrobiaceae bacterium]
MPHTPKPFDVVVSGSNFTGLALALALAKGLGGELSVAVTGVGANPGAGPEATRRSPRAFSIAAASRNLLDRIGVWPSIATEAQPVVEIEITDSALGAGIRPVLLTYDNTVEGGEPASYVVPDACLAGALRAEATATAGITLIAPAATGYEAQGGVARVTLADGSQVTTRLVVAADGRTSPIRRAAGIKTVEWEYRQTGICTEIAHSEPHRGRAVQHFLPGGPFAILPLTGDRSCITWSEDAREARRILALDDSAFLAEIEARCAGRLGTLSLAGARASWPLRLHLARALTGPRLALIGDAARGVHPIAGQGLNLGFRDVAALAEIVAESARTGTDVGDTDGLTRFARWRRFDSTMSTAAFDGLNRLFSNDVRLLRPLREFGLGLVDRLPLAKSLIVKEAAGLMGDVPRLLRGEPI